MRLIGATPRQINVIASVDAIVGALFGALLGSVIFVLIRPAIADVAFSGVKFFPNYITPTIWGISYDCRRSYYRRGCIADLTSSRSISPLGVSRRTTPPKTRSWRLIPLVAGVLLFPYAANHLNNGGSGKGNPGPLFVGFVLIMIGLVLSGSWLTMQVTKVLARLRELHRRF